jgi:hypothetical protein
MEPAPASNWRDGSAVPAGAGLVTPAVPTGEPLGASRSPNKRVLPPSSKLGFWAADEPRASAKEPPRVAGVELPVPEADISGFESWYCAAKMERLLRSEGQFNVTMELRFDDRHCVIARLYDFCLEKGAARAETVVSREKLDTMRKQTSRWLLYACRHTREGKKSVETILKEVTRVWDMIKEGKKRR